MPEPLRHISPRLSVINRAAVAHFLTVRSGLLICALFLLAGLVVAGDYGRVSDEQIQRRIAQANLDYILTRADYSDLPAKTDIDTSQLIPSDRYYGAAFELPLLLAERALGLADYHYVHRLRVTLTHLFFIVGGFFCYLLAYRLFNNRLIALLALLIFLLHPRIYGHSFFNSKDPVFLSMFSLALYLLERAFRRDRLGAFVLLGIAVGLLANLRIMGGLLFPAIIALRGLDLFFAGGGTERKPILLSGGAFVLAAGLTLYAVTPYAWANPIDYLAASLDLTVNHPAVWPQLFQGEWFPSDQLPAHYNAVWFAITTPPLILLLGGIGTAAAAARLCRRPGAVFRNTRQRFLALLLAGFLLPPLAVALLGSNQYNDWRHLYFVYVPFCLLAAGGLGRLAAAWAQRRRWRFGMYGLIAAGLGLILLQMTQLHPLQHLYFNALVDRETPEYLRTQYHFSFWELAYWAGLQRIRKSYPDETLRVRTDYPGEFELLSPADRERLFPVPDGGGRNADYDLLHPIGPGQPDLVFNSAYRPIYNNTVTALRPLDSTRMKPAAVAAYREIYRQAVADEPIIRADYQVYRQGQRLTFIQENCPPDSRDAWFGARLFPPDPTLWPPNAGEIYFYISYRLGNHRVRLGDTCLAVIQLPAAARGYLILSRHNLNPEGPISPPLWAELYSLSPPGLRERIAALRSQQPPPEPDAFAVFLDQDPAGGYRLLYAKANCAPEEYATRPFLHILPENLADLPFYLWQSGVDNREFPLNQYGVRIDGECLAVYPLPDYPISSILTGQAGMWEVNIYPPADPDTLRATYAALSDIQPAARADFDLYIQDNRLIYLRETCADADTAADFFLHIIPIDTADLPADRQAAGFANEDFAFARWGGFFDGKCLAAVPLPDYPVKSLRTGQYIPGQGEGWAAELTIAEGAGR